MEFCAVGFSCPYPSPGTYFNHIMNLRTIRYRVTFRITITACWQNAALFHWIGNAGKGVHVADTSCKEWLEPW